MSTTVQAQQSSETTTAVQNVSRIEQLPRQVMSHMVLGNLDWAELAAVCLVSKTWNRMIKETNSLQLIIDVKRDQPMVKRSREWASTKVGVDQNYVAKWIMSIWKYDLKENAWLLRHGYTLPEVAQYKRQHHSYEMDRIARMM